MSGECIVVGPHERVIEAQAVPYDGSMRHFQQGPADLALGTATDGRYHLDLAYQAFAENEPDFKRRASDILWDPLQTGNFDRWKREGMGYTVTAPVVDSHRLFYWYFRGGGSDASIRQALEDPQGWARAGVSVRQTTNRSGANCEIEIVQSIPGFPSAAGLYRWTGSGRPEVLLVARYLTDPNFGQHLVNHEFGHAIFRCLDMIPAAGFPYYSGVMDYTDIERVPIDREIEDARRWLIGQGVVQ